MARPVLSNSFEVLPDHLLDPLSSFLLDPELHSPQKKECVLSIINLSMACRRFKTQLQPTLDILPLLRDSPHIPWEVRRAFILHKIALSQLSLFQYALPKDCKNPIFRIQRNIEKQTTALTEIKRVVMIVLQTINRSTGTKNRISITTELLARNPLSYIVY